MAETDTEEKVPKVPSTPKAPKDKSPKKKATPKVTKEKSPTKKSPKKRSPKTKAAPKTPKRKFNGLPKRSLSHPYFNNKESGSDSDSESEPDGVVDAVYDVLWITGECAPSYPYYKSGYTITFKHIDTYSNPFSQIPVRRYKAYLSIFNSRAVFSCIRSDYKTYTIFKLLQRNSQMKRLLKVVEAVEIDMLHGVVDDNGYPFLKWHVNCSEKKKYKKGNKKYVYRQGWAKRRATPTSPITELSFKERERLHELDRIEGEDAKAAAEKKTA